MTSSMKQKRESGVLCTPLVRRSCHGRPVNTPPKKKLKPKTQSQWGQEYMTSFFNDPTTSLRTGRESGEEAAFSFRVTGFLQCGHFAIVCSPIFRRCVESMCVSPNDPAHRPGATGSWHATEASSPGSVEPVRRFGYDLHRHRYIGNRCLGLRDEPSRSASSILRDPPRPRTNLSNRACEGSRSR